MKRILIAVSVLAMAFTACKPDSDTQPASTTGSSLNLPSTIVTSSIGDANTIAAQVKIEGASKKTGPVPTPTGGAAPTITDPFSTVKEESFSGGTFGIPVSSSGGSVAGLFVQVKGSDSYLDVPVSSLRTRTESGGIGGGSGDDSNKKKTNVQELPIELPTDFGIGEFCVLYCVYDAANNVSNVIEKCVTVKKLGGNSTFVKEWNMTSMTFQDFDQLGEPLGYVTKPLPGELFSLNQSFPCSDGSTKNVTISSTVNEMKLTLNSNGLFNMSYKGSDTNFDIPSTGSPISDICQYNVVTKNNTSTAIGAWSVNETTGNLVLIYQSETENGVVTELNDAFELKVDAVTSNQLNLADINDSQVKYVMK